MTTERELLNGVANGGISRNKKDDDFEEVLAQVQVCDAAGYLFGVTLHRESQTAARAIDHLAVRRLTQAGEVRRLDLNM